MVALAVVDEQGALGGGCPSGADDADDLVFPHGPDHQHQATLDGPDGDEPVLGVGVSIVEEFKVVLSGREERLGLLERKAVLELVRIVLSGSQEIGM